MQNVAIYSLINPSLYETNAFKHLNTNYFVEFYKDILFFNPINIADNTA